MAFGRGLAQYYNIGRQGISKQFERIGEASQKWGDVLSQLTEAGLGKVAGVDSISKQLGEGYSAYSTPIMEAGDTPMDFDTWKSINQDRIFQENKEARKVEREERRNVLQAEKEYGVKQPGLGGLLQRINPFDKQSGYLPVGSPIASEDVPVVNPNNGVLNPLNSVLNQQNMLKSGMNINPFTGQPYQIGDRRQDGSIVGPGRNYWQ